MRKLVILDRDGVINQDTEGYVSNLSQLVLIESSISAIADLYKAGFNVAIATNQAGINKKLYSHNTLNSIHNQIRLAVMEKGGEIGFIVYCPHLHEENCYCRKPKTGLLEQISYAYQIPLTKKVYFIGDSLTDLEAAKSSGCTGILVKTGKGVKVVKNNLYSKNTLIFDDLKKASEFILQN